MSENACTCEHPKQEPGYVCGPNCQPHGGDRHPKWQRVEPGTVIPAGQPYRAEVDDPLRDGKGVVRTASEFTRNVDWTPRSTGWFVDSSWKPPLVLPTEPTWGIARVKPYRDSDNTRLEAGRCQIDQTDREYFRINGAAYSLNSVLAFAPLTNEQVARIEAAR